MIRGGVRILALANALGIEEAVAIYYDEFISFGMDNG